MFNGNPNLPARLLPLHMKIVESLFNFPQHLTFKILLATISTLATRDIIHNQKFAIVPINILRLARSEFFVTTESATRFHHEPRS